MRGRVNEVIFAVGPDRRVQSADANVVNEAPANISYAPLWKTSVPLAHLVRLQLGGHPEDTHLDRLGGHPEDTHLDRRPGAAITTLSFRLAGPRWLGLFMQTLHEGPQVKYHLSSARGRSSGPPAFRKTLISFSRVMGVISQQRGSRLLRTRSSLARSGPPRRNSTPRPGTDLPGECSSVLGAAGLSPRPPGPTSFCRSATLPALRSRFCRSAPLPALRRSHLSEHRYVLHDHCNDIHYSPNLRG